MEQPKRKHPRLKGCDYSQNGYYHVVIQTQNNLPLLCIVGQGLAPAVSQVTLSSIGMVCQEQLFALESRYDCLKIDCYAIMPTHIHVILVLDGGMAGVSPRPTVMQVVGAYKSLTTRICNQNDYIQGRQLFQTSFYDHVIRNEAEYLQIWNYIDTNPQAWNIKHKGDFL